MSWETVPVAAKTTGSPMVSGFIRRFANGTVRLTLNLSVFAFDELGAPAMVRVDIGRGEHAGSLRIVPDAERGGHKVVNGPRGSKRIPVPHFEGLPGESAPTETCPILSKGGGELIVRLPVAEWEIAIGKARAAALPKSGFGDPAARKPPALPAPKPAAATPAPKPAAATPAPGVKLDMVKYLSAKGAAIRRISPGVYKLEGEQVGPLEMLELVNSYRRRGELPALGLDQVE